MTRIEEMCQKYASELLDGRVLAVDPSSGSRNSLPGYATYHQGKLTDAGFIKFNTNRDKSERLVDLARFLRTEFEAPDVLVIEHISPVFGYQKNGKFRQSINKSFVILHQAVGCILGAVGCPKVIEVTPRTWRQYLPKEKEYDKNDDNDAIMIGYAAMFKAAEIMGREPPELKLVK